MGHVSVAQITGVWSHPSVPQGKTVKPGHMLAKHAIGAWDMLNLQSVAIC